MLTHFFSGATFPSGPGWFFLLQPRADAHSLTAGLGGDASRRGVCFFFLARPRPDRGGFFFAVAPPGRSLTHCGLWRPQQGPGGVFSVFFCGPAEPGEPTTKNVWCTTSGLKRPGGATAEKKKKHFQPASPSQLIPCRYSIREFPKIGDPNMVPYIL